MRPALPLLLCVAALTACGSTVAQTGAASGGATLVQGGDPSLSVPGAGGADGLGGAGTPAGAAGAGAQQGSAGAGSVGGVGSAGTAGTGVPPGATGSAGGSTSTGGGAGPAGGAGLTGPGVTASTISIGLSYTRNAQEAAAALGASGDGAGGGDGKRMWDAVVRSVNDAGGVLGRKLAPVYHVFDATSSEPQASQEQAACETWTRDNKVLWVSYYGGETVTPCLHKAGVAHSSSSLTDASTSFYREHPYYVEAGMLQMDRIAAQLPGRLDAQRFFSAWDTVRGAAGGAQPVKVGIVSFNDARTVHAVDTLLVPAVKRLVPGEPEVVQVAYPRSSAENATSITQTQNATLRFRDAGVTHVIPFETVGAGIGVFFAQGADQQKYYPRYGLSSGNGAQLLLDQGLWPTGQTRGAVGMGWLPLVDLSNADNPDSGPDSNDARRSCVALMTKDGIDVSAAIVKRQALEMCNTVRLLKAALEAGGGSVHRDAFLAGVHALGTSFQSGLTFGTRFGPDHHDGVALVRPFAFTSACGCFRYSGPRVPIA